MGYFKFLFLGTLVSSLAVASHPNIFGKDDREAVTSTDAPWRMVGYFSNGCTATLVTKNLIVTAAHCIFDEKGELLALTFYPNMVSNYARMSSGAAHTWWGTKDPQNNRGEDWAIIRLKDNLGDSYGWMATTDDKQASTVTLVGYSDDFLNGKTASTHIGCTIREKLPAFWLHDCDGTRGSSGGPLFYMKDNQPYIVGVQVAEYRNGGETSLAVSEYSKDYANIGVPAGKFIAKLKEALAE